MNIVTSWVMRPGRARHALIATAAAAGVFVGTAGIAAAASGHFDASGGSKPSTAPSGGSHHGGFRHGGAGGPGGPGGSPQAKGSGGPSAAFGFGGPGHGPAGFGAFGPAGRVLHGQFVVAKRCGGYQTIVTQTGVVTAVSSTSLTVKSADGYQGTFTLTSSTKVNGGRSKLSAIKVGNTVDVSGIKGSATTAIVIGDRTLLPKPTWPTPHAKPSGKPTPTPTSTTHA
jgi:hypothetical protein